MLGTHFRVTYQKLPLSTTKFLKFPYFVNFFVAYILDRVPDLPDIKLCSGDNVKTAFRDGFFLMYLMIRCQALITFNPFAKKFRWTTAPSHLVSITPCVSSSNPTCLIKLAIITTRLTYTWPSLALSTFYQLADHHAHVSSSDHDALF